LGFFQGLGGGALCRGACTRKVTAPFCPFLFLLSEGFSRGRSPLIQRHFSHPQVLDVTPTQDAPCLPGAGSDNDGHPDGAPSSLPRHPTGECPPAPIGSSAPLLTPNSCINCPPLLNNDHDKRFHPKTRFGDWQKLKPFLAPSPGLKGFGTNYVVFFFPPFWHILGSRGLLGKPMPWRGC